MPKKIIFQILILLFAFHFGQAQSDTTELEDENIDIIKDFEPVVQRANKKHFVPLLPTIKTSQPSFSNYNLPISYEEVDYRPSEIKPLRIPKEDPVSLPYIYLKAGFGNYLTPLVDFQVSNKNTEKFRIGAGLQHLSSNRKKIENQRFSETDAEVLAEAYFKGMTMGVQPYYSRHNYHFYGYDQDDTTFSKDATQNLYQGGGVNIFLFNHEDNALDLDYSSDIGLHSIKDGYGNSEINFNWELGVSKKFREIFSVGGDVFLDMTSLKSIVNQNRFAFGLNPYLEAGKDRWQVRAGLWVLLDNGTFYVLPDIRHQSKLFKNYIVMYNEWIGHLELNSLRTLSAENPWLMEDIRYNHYRIEERNFIGFKGHVPVGIDYDTRFSQIVYYDIPLLVNDTSAFRSFMPRYDDKLKAWNAHVSLGYQYADFLKIRASFDYYNYNPEDEQKAWHLPSFRSGITATYQWNNKLIVKADVFGYSGVNALDADGSVVKLKGTADLNFSASYHLNKHVAFFAQVNNAISLKHKQYYKYPGYGFVALGGIVASF